MKLAKSQSKTRLTPQAKQRIIDSQRDAFKRYGYHPHALLWSDTLVQELRFKILTEIGIKAGDSVLDVGCGFGDFSAYLARHDKWVDFTGIDLSEELLIEGKKKFPKIKLIKGDLFDFNPSPENYDYVTLSGTLNRKFDGSREYALHVIERMFQSCKKGIAFNLLDSRHEWTAGRWDLQSFHPDEVIKFIKQMPKKSVSQYQIIDGYLDNDFSVYLWRSTG